mgnify:CR=1 FL=1
MLCDFFFFQAEDGIRDLVRSRGLGDVYKRQLRKDKGQTLHQVSVGTDIDSPLLSKLERGERLPTAEQIKKLSLIHI